MIASGIEHDGRAAKTAPAAAVDVLGAAGDREVRETEPPLPDPGPGPPPLPPLGDTIFDPGVDEVILSRKRSQILLNFNMKFKQTRNAVFKDLFNQFLLLFINQLLLGAQQNTFNMS